MHMVVNFCTHIFHLIQVSKHSIPLFFPSFLHSLFNGRNCLFFVFVGNVEPKTEMEDANTNTNTYKSDSSSPSGSPLRTGRCPLQTMWSPSPFSRSSSPLSPGSSPSGSPKIILGSKLQLNNNLDSIKSFSQNLMHSTN